MVYAHPESVRENKTHNLLISARRPDLVIVNNNKKKKKKGKKRTCRIVNFAFLADHRVKLKESEKRGKCLDFAKELKKQQQRNIKVTVIPVVMCALGTVTKGLVQRLEGLGNKRTSGDLINYSIVEIDQNTKKSP